MIKATLIDDNEIFYIDFNVTAWFEQANDDQIVALAKSGWSCSEEADVVADFFSNQDKEVMEFFTCLGLVNKMSLGCGYHCAISNDDAIKWVTIARSHLVKAICRS